MDYNEYIPVLTAQMNDAKENLHPTNFDVLIPLSFSASYSLHEMDTHPYKT